MSFRELIEGKNEMPSKDTDGVYMCVKFTQETNENLYDFTQFLGLDPIKPEDLHATIVYSIEPLDIPHGVKPCDGVCYPTGLKYLGEKMSKWRALVLEVQSNKLQELYDEAVQKYGYVSQYDSYVQHISLAYKPPEDLDLSDVTLPDFPIEIDKIVVEPLKV